MGYRSWPDPESSENILPTMDSKEYDNAAQQTFPSPVLPSDGGPGDNVSSDSQEDGAVLGREPMETWRLTLVLAWYGEMLSRRNSR